MLNQCSVEYLLLDRLLGFWEVTKSGSVHLGLKGVLTESSVLDMGRKDSRQSRLVIVRL